LGRGAPVSQFITGVLMRVDMKIKDLIIELEKYPEDAIVVLSDNEDYMYEVTDLVLGLLDKSKKWGYRFEPLSALGRVTIEEIPNYIKDRNKQFISVKLV
jgi:hypothetical protein